MGRVLFTSTSGGSALATATGGDGKKFIRIDPTVSIMEMLIRCEFGYVDPSFAPGLFESNPLLIAVKSRLVPTADIDQLEKTHTHACVDLLLTCVYHFPHELDNGPIVALRSKVKLGGDIRVPCVGVSRLLGRYLRLVPIDKLPEGSQCLMFGRLT